MDSAPPAENIRDPTRPFPSRARSLVELLHPLPTAATVAAGGVIAWIIGFPGHGVALSMFGVLLASQIGVSLFNDLCDVDLDSVARPERALPRGLIRPMWVEVAALVALAVSLAFSVSFGGAAFILVAITLLSGILYTAWLKRTIWSWLPFAIAFPLLPAWQFVVLKPHTSNLWTLWVVGVPCAIAVHLSDSIPDIETDRAGGVEGLAVRLGTDASVLACRLLLLAGAFAAIAVPLVNNRGYAVVGATACAVFVGISWKVSTAWLRFVAPAAAFVVSLAWVAALSR